MCRNSTNNRNSRLCSVSYNVAIALRTYMHGGINYFCSNNNMCSAIHLYLKLIFQLPSDFVSTAFDYENNHKHRIV
jgi:hypothetical protein